MIITAPATCTTFTPMSEESVPQGFEIVTVPIHEVRFHKPAVKSKRYDDGRVVDFYAAEPDQYVRSYADGSLKWAPVAGYSIHQNCKIVIVNLSNGCQIITDHDPRAVFGLDPASDSFDLERFYPDEALSKKVLVPCRVFNITEDWGTDKLRETYVDLWKAVGRKAYLFNTHKLNSRISYDKEREVWVLENCAYSRKIRLPAPRCRRELHSLTEVECQTLEAHLCREFPEEYEVATFFEWQNLFRASAVDNVTWATVESIEITDKAETCYDLTVPGFETFMSSDGVVLSNTMNIHVVSHPDTIKETYEKLMPSKMLFSTKKRGAVVPELKQEQLLGTFSAYKRPAKRSFKFASKEEALAAIERNEVSLSDDIEIPDDPVVDPLAPAVQPPAAL